MSQTQRIVLHIGPPKTGTSAIQAFLSLNRERLLAQGVNYPGVHSDARARRGEGTVGNAGLIAHDLKREADGVERAVRAVKGELAAGAPTVLYSTELFWSLFDRQFQPLVRALWDIAPVEVLFYVRPQVEHVRSWYLQKVRDGGCTTDIEPFFTRHRHLFRFGERAETLADLIGRDRVMVRRYGEADVLDDLLAALGLKAGVDFERPERAVNPTSDVEHYLYGRVINAGFGKSDVLRRAEAALTGAPELASLYAEAEGRRDTLLSAELAAAIRDACAEDNRRLDAFVGEPGFGLDAANAAAVAALAAEPAAGPQPLTRLEVLLMSRLADLEAKVAELSRAQRPG